MKLTELSLKNYSTIDSQTLDGLSDFNIIIGPNNSGKSSILKAIDKIQQFESGRSPLNDTEVYLEDRRRAVRIIYTFEDQSFELWSSSGDLRLKNEENKKEQFGKITTLFCEEGRLNSYKKEDPGRYLSGLFSDLGYEKTYEISEKIEDDLRKIADPNIQGVSGPIVGKAETVRLACEPGERVIEPELERHGSGVRSLALLLTEIYVNDPDIILLDEPELGLNPAGKRCFLQRLIDLSDDYQIFISTQDSSFVNPLFWKDDENKVSVFHYSISRVIQGREAFVNVEVDEPKTFAGYLPQSTTLKDAHIYVEGKEDVRVFRAYLQRYLEEKSEHFDSKGDVLNRAEIYHLGGSNWEHFLSTIPGAPYSSLVVLDGNMEGQAETVVKRYRDSGYDNLPSFLKCDNLEEVSRSLSTEDEIPVYCLQKDDISEYAGVEDKREAEPQAWKQDSIPGEIEDLFDILFLGGVKVYQAGSIDSGELNKWQEANGNWEAREGELHQTHKSGNNVITLSGFQLKDGIFEADINSVDGGAGQQLIWRGDGDVASNYYIFGTGNLSSDNPIVRAGVYKDGKPQWIKKKNIKNGDLELGQNEFHTYKAEFKGNVHKVYIDNHLVWKIKDDKIEEAGLVGFHCGRHTSFRNVKVWKWN
ncbi:hypothetical protein AKJ48_03395 [candidate division MSBL1 archaeon SCGC-AAA261O19]|nr:hypothetical protein AKJ48_03395 [candidate division MSBL1 archaeon SCGC-AAA261O19]